VVVKAEPDLKAQQRAITSSKGGNSSKSKLDTPDSAPVQFHLDDGTRERAVGYSGVFSPNELAALWLNRFSPPAGAFPITLNSIQIVWPDQPNIVGQQARLLVYLDADGDNN